MSGNLSIRYALRSLGRSRRRTGLSILGVGLGCAIALFATAFMRGGQTMRVQAISQSGYGHLRIAPAGWEQSRRDELRLQDSAAALAAVRGLEGVAVAAPHVRVQGLLAFGTRVAGVQFWAWTQPPSRSSTDWCVLLTRGVTCKRVMRAQWSSARPSSSAWT